jgi:hypothetical protein
VSTILNMRWLLAGVGGDLVHLTLRPHRTASFLI